jgi:type II secretory pathway pseudopilin PulG
LIVFIVTIIFSAGRGLRHGVVIKLVVSSLVMKKTKKAVAHGVNWKSRSIQMKAGLVIVILALILYKTVPGVVRAYDVQRVDQAIQEAKTLAQSGQTEEAVAVLQSTSTRYMTSQQAEEITSQLGELAITSAKGMSFYDFDQMLKDRGELGIFASPSLLPKPSLQPTRIPTISPSSSPTPNTNPQVRCYYDNRCGGTKITTRDECTNTVCCYNGSAWNIESKADCQKRSDETAQKQLDAWNESQAQMKSEIEAIQKAVETLSTQNAQAEAELLESCRDQAQQTYKQPAQGSQTSGNGYVVGESTELRQALNRALQRCLDLYGEGQ